MALFRLKKNTDDDKTPKKDEVVSNTKEVKEKVEVANADTAVEKSKTPKKKAISPDTLSLNYNKDVSSVLKHPRVTEKATLMSESGVYVFDVSSRATKADVAEAIKALYKVTPRKINMVKVPSKKVRMRRQQNKYGVKSGGKKAYVYVKKGDTIDIV